jgi:hypothetical protein
MRKWLRGTAVPSLFFSYSHKDEDLRDQLETQLASLQRQGLISSWHDRRITAGTEIDVVIDKHLDEADIILLLISPDFIASDYCYNREMDRALARHNTAEARVIPVILRPCLWQGLPFGKLMATPPDGRPITMSPNTDQAFLEVVLAIKKALVETDQKQKPAKLPSVSVMAPGATSATQQVVRSSNLRIKKQFTDLDKDRFLHDGFEYVAKYFENSMKELAERNRGIDQTFRRIDATQFIAAVYRGGAKVCAGSAFIGGTMMSNSIAYVMTDEPRHGGMNESVSVKADDQSLYFGALGMQSYGDRKDNLSFEGAAELFWEIFIRPIQS